ncbi:MAG: 23S rRNA (guanosine(2251)-2'-O)-methyltransferase RlmB [Butyrivibrio sp.]|nr:23S rRNA (guanosine(2251)-2'-O)-methyltransferase RlmB [Butyrivibrio sp.]
MSTNRNFYKKAQKEQNKENRKTEASKNHSHKYDGDVTGREDYKADFIAGEKAASKSFSEEEKKLHGLDLEGAKRENDDIDTDIHSLTIEGRNAVLEAIRSGKTIDKLFVLDGCQDGPVSTIRREASKLGIMMKFVSRERLDQISDTGKHQGVIAYAAAYDYAEMDDIFALAEKRNEKPFIILLDNIEDPHNLGAIIRTANIAGAHGVVIPKNRAVGLTATVAKASAGALNYTPVVKVTNIAQTIEELKKRGVWFVCADMDGTPMYDLDLKGPIGLVIGNEGSGVSRLVSEKCDMIATIPMKGEINSLNASVAAGVLAYEIVRQRMN